jgi:hypothetical protein
MALNEILVSVATVTIVAVLGWLARAVFALQKLMEHETKPNGGTSFKDYMNTTTIALNKQTETMESLRHEMTEHNRLTSELIGSLIRSGRQ